MRYVAFLRGVNVNGRTIRMADLTKTIEDLGYEDVRTVQASGNVVFTTSKAKAAVKKAVEAQLSDTFGYSAFVVVLTAAEVTSIVTACPFDSAGDRHAYVMVSSAKAALTELGKADVDPDMEEVTVGAKALYWHVRKGHSTKTPFAKAAARPKYVSAVTSRNLNTMNRIEAVL